MSKQECPRCKKGLLYYDAYSLDAVCDVCTGHPEEYSVKQKCLRLIRHATNGRDRCKRCNQNMRVCSCKGDFIPKERHVTLQDILIAVRDGDTFRYSPSLDEQCDILSQFVVGLDGHPSSDVYNLRKSAEEQDEEFYEFLLPLLKND